MLATLTWPALGVLGLIAGIVGAVNVAVEGWGSGTFVVSVLLAFAGAIMGPLIAQHFQLAELVDLRIADQPFPLISSAAGAGLVVVMKHFASGNRLLRN